MRANRFCVESVQLNHQIYIDTLTFLSGHLTLTLENQLPCPVRTLIQIEELDFDSTVFLSPTSYNHFNLNLAGRCYINSNPTIIALSCNTEVIVEPTNQPIHFTEPVRFITAYTLFDLKIANFTGTIYDTVKSRLRPDTLKLNLPQSLTGINIVQAELEAELVSGLGFSTIFYLNLNAGNNHGDQIVHDTILIIQPGSPSLPRTTNLSLDMTALINIVPNKIVITGYRVITGSGRGETDAFFTGAYSFSSPLRLSFDTSTIDFKRQEIKIKEAYRADIKRYLVSGEIISKYVNHLPFGLAGVLKIESPTANPVTIPFQMPMPEINEISGFVQTPKETTIVISLNDNEANIFKQDTIYATASLFLPKTDTVTISACDYFSVEYSYCRLKLNLLK